MFASPLLQRLVFYVSLGLLVFAILTGALIYRSTYQQELKNAAALERQLVQTIQAQAEIAAFANNNQIANDLIEGLRANPQIRAVRLAGSSADSINLAAGFSGSAEPTSETEYPLYSPVDDKERIGVLVVAHNDALIEANATLSALQQTLLLLGQLLATAVLILLVFRQLVGKPLTQLAEELAAIKPGAGTRLSVSATHAHDEIGSLANSANALITAAEQALNEIKALATTDPLTGLPNRRAFMEKMVEELSRFQRQETTPASLLMLDLDHFKDINDRYGHAAGDSVLRRFGEILAGELRKIDAAGRLGGEEFAVVLPNTEAAPAVFFAERLCRKLAEQPIEHQGLTISVTTSIGVASMLPGDSQPEEVIARADLALYQAKAKGRNRVEVMAHDRGSISAPA